MGCRVAIPRGSTVPPKCSYCGSYAAVEFLGCMQLPGDTIGSRKLFDLYREIVRACSKPAHQQRARGYVACDKFDLHQERVI